MTIEQKKRLAPSTNGKATIYITGEDVLGKFTDSLTIDLPFIPACQSIDFKESFKKKIIRVYESYTDGWGIDMEYND